MDGTAVLQMNGITKIIDNIIVLNQIQLSFDRGCVYGIVGENGSGKTMLLRLAAGLIFPSSGELLWEGKPMYGKNRKEKIRVGLTLEHTGLYPQLTGRENLMLLAEVQKEIGEKEINEALLRVGLSPDDSRPFRKYSLGMRQRLMLAQAMMEKPSLLLLDEPTSALDETGRSQIHRVIREEAERGALILMSSHSREELELCCGELIRLHQGSVVARERSQACIGGRNFIQEKRK